MGTKLYLSLAHDEVACDEFCAVLTDALVAVTGNRDAVHR
jgi:hypothetical protein